MNKWNVLKNKKYNKIYVRIIAPISFIRAGKINHEDFFDAGN